MTEQEYIKTLCIDGQDVDLGLDDYGQCYFIEWIDETGRRKDMGLGTYNFRYMEEIYYMFDPIYKILASKDLWGEDMTTEEKTEWQKYQDLFNQEYEGLN